MPDRMTKLEAGIRHHARGKLRIACDEAVQSFLDRLRAADVFPATIRIAPPETTLTGRQFLDYLANQIRVTASPDAESAAIDEFLERQAAIDDS